MAFMKVKGHEYWFRNYRMSQDTDKKLKAIKKKVDKNWDGTFRAMIEAFNQTNRVS